MVWHWLDHIFCTLISAYLHFKHQRPHLPCDKEDIRLVKTDCDAIEHIIAWVITRKLGVHFSHIERLDGSQHWEIIGLHYHSCGEIYEQYVIGQEYVRPNVFFPFEGVFEVFYLIKVGEGFACSVFDLQLLLYFEGARVKEEDVTRSISQIKLILRMSESPAFFDLWREIYLFSYLQTFLFDYYELFILPR